MALQGNGLANHRSRVRVRAGHHCVVTLGKLLIPLRELRKLTDFAKITKKTPPFKVVQGHRVVTNRTGIYSFYEWLIVTSAISRTVSEIRRLIGQKVASDMLRSHLTTSLWMIPCEYADKLISPKLETMRPTKRERQRPIPESKYGIILHSFVLIH